MMPENNCNAFCMHGWLALAPVVSCEQMLALLQVSLLMVLCTCPAIAFAANLERGVCVFLRLQCMSQQTFK